jgi:hypothetical protein
MEKKKGLVDRILSSAKDDDAGAPGKVHRKKITLNDLKTVIEEYVQRTAGMGDPELRSRIVQMELGFGTLREQTPRSSVPSSRPGPGGRPLRTNSPPSPARAPAAPETWKPTSPPPGRRSSRSTRSWPA